MEAKQYTTKQLRDQRGNQKIPGQNYNSNRYMHPYVHSSTFCSSQIMETT